MSNYFGNSCTWTPAPSCSSRSRCSIGKWHRETYSVSPASHGTLQFVLWKRTPKYGRRYWARSPNMDFAIRSLLHPCRQQHSLKSWEQRFFRTMRAQHPCVRRVCLKSSSVISCHGDSGLRSSACSSLHTMAAIGKLNLPTPTICTKTTEPHESLVPTFALTSLHCRFTVCTEGRLSQQCSPHTLQTGRFAQGAIAPLTHVHRASSLTDCWTHLQRVLSIVIVIQ